eukprot:scaffold11809_cov128-Cylindrotheca_fusiformis.AAC.22
MEVETNSAALIVDNPQMPSSLPELEKLSMIEPENASKTPKVVTPSISPLKSPISPRKFKLGMIINSSSTVDGHISSIAKPSSSCSLLDLVVLDTKEREGESMKTWLKTNNISATDTEIHWGEDGLQQLLASDIEAVYIIVPADFQKECVMRSLEAGKHVLLNDPVSTSFADFKDQQKCAKQHGKFIQFSTMFVHQYNVRRFIDRVLCDEGFGEILKIHCHVRLCYDDLDRVGVKMPLGESDGSIRVIGRYCVLVSALFFSRMGILAHSAQVKSMELGRKGEVSSAKCVVKFTKGRELEFDVGYTSHASRQSIDLLAENKTAQMKDFIIEHPDRLATYRVYDKAPSSSGTMEIVRGEAIDVAGGPPEQFMMWRRFAELATSLDKQGGWDHTEQTAECRELANVALQTKRILIALAMSIDNSFEEVIIDDIDYQ